MVDHLILLLHEDNLFSLLVTYYQYIISKTWNVHYMGFMRMKVIKKDENAQVR